MSTPKPTPTKKAKATPNGNPFGLTAREVEIAIVAWKCLEADGKASSESHPSTPKSNHTQTQTQTHTNTCHPWKMGSIITMRLAKETKSLTAASRLHQNR